VEGAGGRGRGVWVDDDEIPERGTKKKGGKVP